MSENEAIGSHWDGVLASEKPSRVRWWEDVTTIRHINQLVSGSALDSLHAGFHERLSMIFRIQPARRAISVGCGTASKELHLLQAGVVQIFDCYEFSKAAIDHGRRVATDLGLTERLRFHYGDAFGAELPTDYDLVYWNNALHHMPSAERAIVWSKNRLRPGGIFAMDDYVGPTRFQWTDVNLEWANRVLATLPDGLLRSPYDPLQTVSRVVTRPSPEAVIAVDPSEAADSGNILPALRRVFPLACIIRTGGCIYHLALNDIFHNFNSADEIQILKSYLLLDQCLAENGETQYAVAIAFNI
jgi:SAM-dependent methyltransferase